MLLLYFEYGTERPSIEVVY